MERKTFIWMPADIDVRTDPLAVCAVKGIEHEIEANEESHWFEILEDAKADFDQEERDRFDWLMIRRIIQLLPETPLSMINHLKTVVYIGEHPGIVVTSEVEKKIKSEVEAIPLHKLFSSLVSHPEQGLIDLSDAIPAEEDRIFRYGAVVEAMKPEKRKLLYARYHCE